MFVRVKLASFQTSGLKDAHEDFDCSFCDMKDLASFLVLKARNSDVNTVLFGRSHTNPQQEIFDLLDLITGLLEKNALVTKVLCVDLQGRETQIYSDKMPSQTDHQKSQKKKFDEEEATTKKFQSLQQISAGMQDFMQNAQFDFVQVEAESTMNRLGPSSKSSIKIFQLHHTFQEESKHTSEAKSWVKSSTMNSRNLSPRSEILEISTSQDLWKLDSTTQAFEPMTLKKVIPRYQHRITEQSTPISTPPGTISVESRLSLCSLLRTISPGSGSVSLENSLLSGEFKTGHPMLLFVLKFGTPKPPAATKLDLIFRNAKGFKASLKGSSDALFNSYVSNVKKRVKELRNIFYKQYDSKMFQNDMEEWKQKIRQSSSMKLEQQVRHLSPKYSQFPLLSPKFANRSRPNVDRSMLSSKAAFRAAGDQISPQQIYKPLFRIESKGYLADLLGGPPRRSRPLLDKSTGDSLTLMNTHHLSPRIRN